MRSRATDTALAHMRARGFDRMRLSEVAKELGVSHAALYAHFRDKAALLDAVTERWLGEVQAELDRVCGTDAAPLMRVHDWFVTGYRMKRRKALRDPELFRAFDKASASNKPVVVAHLQRARTQLARLLQEGGVAADEAEAQTQLLWEATMSFHHPKLMAERANEDREPLLRRLLAVLLKGELRPDAAKAPASRCLIRP